MALRSAWCLSALGLALAACVTTVPAHEAARELVVRLDDAPLVDALGRAVQSGDDAVARQLLERLYAREPQGDTLEIAHVFERILDGREVIAQLDFELRALPVSADDGVVRLVLSVRNDGPDAVELTTGPGTLVVDRTSVFRAGHGESIYETTTFEGLKQLTLAAGGAREVELLRTRLARPQGPLATRYRWKVRLRAGEVVRADEALPAQRMPVSTLDIVRLAPDVAAEPVTPQELARALEARELAAGEILELAVRVPPAELGQALDALRPVALTLSYGELERALPVLRWLVPHASAGGDVRVWRAWLRNGPERPGSTGSGDLDLPRALASGGAR